MPGIITSERLDEMRLKYEGKLIRIEGRIGIVTKVETWAEHYPHHVANGGSPGLWGYLVFDLKELSGRENNLWLSPGIMQVWSDHAS